MIDLVDWAQAKAESNWRRKGFLGKLFSAPEQQLILQSPDPERLVWTLWSMKESVYKLSLTHNQNRRYAPLSLDCQILSSSSETVCGRVTTNGMTYLTHSSLTSKYVITTASVTGEWVKSVLVSFENTSYSCQHETMLEKIRSYLTQHFECTEPWLRSKTPQGITSFSSAHHQLLVPCTHHGHFGAFIVIPSQR